MSDQQESDERWFRGIDEDEYDQCPRCNEIVEQDEPFHEMPNGDYVCQSCYESEIDAVHDMMKDRLYEGY